MKKLLVEVDMQNDLIAAKSRITEETYTGRRMPAAPGATPQSHRNWKR